MEDSLNAKLRERFEGRGWGASLTGYTGYGGPTWVRALGRVLVRRPGYQDIDPQSRRGWRSFVTIPVVGARVRITVAGRTHEVTTDRGGYVDARVSCELPVGWQSITLTLLDGPNGEPAEPVQVPVSIVDPDARLGVISDIDDTVMITLLPRAMLAAWNTFVLNENARKQVTGMSVLYERLARRHPEAPFIYLSTGAWNVAPTLTRFLSRNLYPRGPLLLTDWGPTHNGWFRSGQLHKRRTLQELAKDFPSVRWVLIGDDGQHDPDIYSEFARSHPDHVAAVAIRTLSPSEQLLASGLPVPMDQASSVPGTPWVSAPDGAALWHRLSDLDLVAAGPHCFD